MKNKNLLIGGAVVVGGALLFFYLRKKRNAENAENPLNAETGSTEKGMGIGTSGTGSGSGSGSGMGSTPSSTPTLTAQEQAQAMTNNAISAIQKASNSKLSNTEVNVRLLKRCGITPPSALKNQRNNFDACKDKFKDELRSQGLISFNGMVEDNRSRLDFDGNIVD